MFSLRYLRFLLWSRDLDVLRAQRIRLFILITHKSARSEHPVTWMLLVVLIRVTQISDPLKRTPSQGRALVKVHNIAFVPQISPASCHRRVLLRVVACPGSSIERQRVHNRLHRQSSDSKRRYHGNSLQDEARLDGARGMGRGELVSPCGSLYWI